MTYNTTISLDETTRSIAQERIKNLSAFVRDMIRIHYGVDKHTLEVQKYYFTIPGTVMGGRGKMVLIRRCNPYSKQGRCYLCWPESNSELSDMILEAALKEGEEC